MLIVNGRPEATPGIRVTSYGEEPSLALSREDFRIRARAPRVIVLHTTKGIPALPGKPGPQNRPQDIRPGLGAPAGAGERAARLWAGDERSAAAHLTVDFDGHVYQHADLITVAAYHAGPVNEVSVGIEIYQGRDAELYEGQIYAVVALVDWLTARLGIQRQIPDAYRGGPIPRLERGARDFVGVIGHRDCSGNRGAGDPGDAVFVALAAAGYERFDVAAGADLAAWRARQQSLGLKPDGIPGPATERALMGIGAIGGLWALRPGAARVA
jgi:hypothetical protein